MGTSLWSISPTETSLEIENKHVSGKQRDELPRTEGVRSRLYTSDQHGVDTLNPDCVKQGGEA